MRKSIKHLNFHAKNMDFDTKLHVGKKISFDQFFDQNSKFLLFCHFRFRIFRQIQFHLKFPKVDFLTKSVKNSVKKSWSRYSWQLKHFQNFLLMLSTSYKSKTFHDNEFQYFAYLKLIFFWKLLKLIFSYRIGHHKSQFDFNGEIKFC